jgi:hypothetical protein
MHSDGSSSMSGTKLASILELLDWAGDAYTCANQYLDLRPKAEIEVTRVRDECV